jgi:hypothetical protein
MSTWQVKDGMIFCKRNLMSGTVGHKIYNKTCRGFFFINIISEPLSPPPEPELPEYDDESDFDEGSNNNDYNQTIQKPVLIFEYLKKTRRLYAGMRQRMFFFLFINTVIVPSVLFSVKTEFRLKLGYETKLIPDSL